MKLVNVLKLTRDDLNEIGSEIGNNAGSGGFAFPNGCKSVPASTTAPLHGGAGNEGVRQRILNDIPISKGLAPKQRKTLRAGAFHVLCGFAAHAGR